MGSVEPSFLPQVQPESPGNGISDVPDFEIFRGNTPLACRTFGAHKFEPPFTKSWIRPSRCTYLELMTLFQLEGELYIALMALQFAKLHSTYSIWGSLRIQPSPVGRLRFQTSERGLKLQPPNGRRLYPQATIWGTTTSINSGHI